MPPLQPFAPDGVFGRPACPLVKVEALRFRLMIIHHVALAALVVKILCAALTLALLAIHFLRQGSAPPGVATWRGLSGLGLTALTAAAVLRWFS